MRKKLNFIGWVTVSMIAVELYLSMTFTPVASQTVIIFIIFGSLALAFVGGLMALGFVAWRRTNRNTQNLLSNLMYDRQQERAAFVRLADNASLDHRQTIKAIVTLSQAQSERLARAVELGAQLVQLENGRYGAALNGQIAPLTSGEAAHFYDLKNRQLPQG